MIYYRGRWLIEPEIKALLTKLEAENEELKQENTVILRETDRLIKEKGQLIAENYEAKKLLRSIRSYYRENIAWVDLFEEDAQRLMGGKQNGT